MGARKRVAREGGRNFGCLSATQEECHAVGLEDTTERTGETFLENTDVNQVDLLDPIRRIKTHSTNRSLNLRWVLELRGNDTLN